MEEYIFRKATITEWQKWLNQWRHRYDLDILKIVHHNAQPHGNEECTIYLIRKEQ